MKTFNAINNNTKISTPLFCFDSNDFNFTKYAVQESACRLFSVIGNGNKEMTLMNNLPAIQREIYKRLLYEAKKGEYVDARFYLKDAIDGYISRIDRLINGSNYAIMNGITGEVMSLINLRDGYDAPDMSKWIHITTFPGICFTTSTFTDTEYFRKTK